MKMEDKEDEGKADDDGGGNDFHDDSLNPKVLRIP